MANKIDGADGGPSIGEGGPSIGGEEGVMVGDKIMGGLRPEPSPSPTPAGGGGGGGLWQRIRAFFQRV